MAQPLAPPPRGLQGFCVYNACGGGTGSGLGCLMLERLWHGCITSLIFLLAIFVRCEDVGAYVYLHTIICIHTNLYLYINIHPYIYIYIYIIPQKWWLNLDKCEFHQRVSSTIFHIGLRKLARTGQDKSRGKHPRMASTQLFGIDL